MPLVKLGLAEHAFHHFKRHTSSHSLHLLPGGSTCATKISFESALHHLMCMACSYDLLSLEIQHARNNMKICLAPLVLPYRIFLQFRLLWPRHLKHSFSKQEKHFVLLFVDIAQKETLGLQPSTLLSCLLAWIHTEFTAENKQGLLKICRHLFTSTFTNHVLMTKETSDKRSQMQIKF